MFSYWVAVFSQENLKSKNNDFLRKNAIFCKIDDSGLKWKSMKTHKKTMKNHSRNASEGDTEKVRAKNVVKMSFGAPGAR